ncbi:gluconolactonase [Rothia sp. HMSC072B03]|uniref:S-layer homology domain-containing protein n=1 Tax=Rothia sp. HMSC072B03 TaxID=1715109 RepID=UPI0008A33228|nr:S-layer homology domain-containing protein [Rothia sp. HMSC072B03]OFM97459.1 gluconolactonase [Rothia sp. HMSC072B03]
MSSLPNSKAPSSFARAAQGCGALVLAGAMVFPMSPALAQNVTAEAPAAVAAGSLPANPTPKAGGDQKAETNAFTPHWSYSALTDTSKDQDFHFNGWDFNGDINSPKGVQILIREKGSNTAVLAISDIVEYNDPEYAFQYQHGLLNGNVKIPANTLDSAKQYTVEVWGNNGYEGSDKLVTPVVGQAPEGRGTLLAWQDLNFKGSDGVQAANLPTTQDNDKKPEPTPDPKPVEQTTTFEASVLDGYKYDGVNPFLITTEGGTVHVKGSGYTKEWRAQHGTVALYIAPAKYAPSGYRIPTSDMLRFVEGQDFTIADDGTFEADLKVEAYKLAAYYFIDDDIFHDPTGGTKYDVRYNIHVVAEQKGQKPLTAQELWTSKNVVSTRVLNTLGEKPEPFVPRLSYNAVADSAKAQVLHVGGQGFNGDIHSVKGVQFVVREKGSNTPVLATSDIIEFDHPTQASAYRDGNLNGTVNLPANTLDASKKYVIEVWANDGYSENGELLAPVVGKSTEGRGTLLAWQDLDLNGTNGYRDANLPKAQDPNENDNQNPDPSDEKLETLATRGELTAALYVQAGTPEVKLPETSPWPDVKTTDPNFPAYVWARQKGITFGWSDGKFHADAGVSNATVAAFTYRAAGSPAVTGTSSYKDVTPGSAFYREILWAQQNKVVLNANGTFDAQHMVTKAELATLIAAYQAR